MAENNVDDEAMAKILTYPNAIVGLSDGGAHVQFHGGYGYSTRLLSEWVREKQVMTLLPGRRLAREGARSRHHGDDRQRPSADGERQAHRRIARPGAAQHLLSRQSRLD
jgi:hypothetical protein